MRGKHRLAGREHKTFALPPMPLQTRLHAKGGLHTAERMRHQGTAAAAAATHAAMYARTHMLARAISSNVARHGKPGYFATLHGWKATPSLSGGTAPGNLLLPPLPEMPARPPASGHHENKPRQRHRTVRHHPRYLRRSVGQQLCSATRRVGQSRRAGYCRAFCSAITVRGTHGAGRCTAAGKTGATGSRGELGAACTATDLQRAQVIWPPHQSRVSNGARITQRSATMHADVVAQVSGGPDPARLSADGTYAILQGRHGLHV